MPVISAAFAAPVPGPSAKNRGFPRGRRRGLLQILCKCSQSNRRAAPTRGCFRAADQLRGGKIPDVAMHRVKGNPVAVKMGFAVG